MPAKSAKQYKLMAGVMSGSINKPNIKKSVAQDFVHNTPAKKRSVFMKHLKNSKKKKGE